VFILFFVYASSIKTKQSSNSYRSKQGHKNVHRQSKGHYK